MNRPGPITLAALIGLSILVTGCSRTAPRSTPEPVALTPEPVPSAVQQAPAPVPPSVLAQPAPARAPSKDEWAQIGRLVPKALADSLEPLAAAALADATARALETGPSGRAVPWAMGTVKGTIIPQPLKRTKGANQCRDMIQSIGARSQPGTACKNGQGDWVLAPGTN